MLQASTSHAVADLAPAMFPRDRFLRLGQVMDIVGLKRTCIYEMIKVGAFPAPCKPGGRVSRWSENEVQSWLSNCISQRVH